MKKVLTLAAAIALSACASNQPAPVAPSNTGPIAHSANDVAPDWVFMPKSNKGLASSACVNWSGSMTVDRAQAIAAARADLAQQIQVKASVLDKLYSRKTTSGDSEHVGGTFEQVSQQISNETLAGSKPEQISFATIDSKKYLCALVVLENTREVFDTLVDGSNRTLDPMSTEALYEEFKAQKAMDELRELLQ